MSRQANYLSRFRHLLTLAIVGMFWASVCCASVSSIWFEPSQQVLTDKPPPEPASGGKHSECEFGFSFACTALHGRKTPAACLVRHATPQQASARHPPSTGPPAV